MQNGHTTIQLLGEQHAVQLPDFATREELVLAFAEHAGTMRRLRVYAAMVGLCTPIGKVLRLDYAKAKCDPLVYGGAVYNWLREEKKMEIGEVVRVGTELLDLLHARQYPREAEVAATTDFSSPAGAQ